VVWFGLRRNVSQCFELSALNGLEAAARILSQPPIPDAWWHIFEVWMLNRMRSLLHQGVMTAYYFSYNGHHSVPREFWATAQADGVMESSTYIIRS
jgi:hypothetical protein